MKHDWEYKPLGEVCDIINGKNQRQVECPTGKYPIMGSGGVMGYASDYLCEAGTTIIGRKGTINRPIFVNQRFWNVDTAFGIQPKLGVEPKFVYYLCKSIDFKKYDKSVTIPSLVKSDLLKIPFPVPPLTEQKQICSLLDKMNRVIEAKKEQLKELDNLSQSLFYDMFGDPTINEKGWEVKKMGDFGSFQRGLLLQKKDFVENGCPCIHYGQLHTSFGAYTIKHLTNISQELFSKSKIAHKGDLILALTSEDVEGSCKSTAWLGDYDIAVGSDAAIFSHNQDGIYLSFYTRTRAFYNEKDKYARGFKVTHIKTSDIATFPICLPPLPLQQSFAKKVEAIERQKELINQSIKDVQTLFDAKMDYYFGE